MRAFGYTHVETGAIIRAKAGEDSPLGRKIKESDDKGKHASDELMTELLMDYLKWGPADKPLLLDGYPRTLPQMRMLDDVLTAVGRNPQAARAVYIRVPREIAEHRLLQRAVCVQCRKVFAGRDVKVCDQCGAEVKARDYDNPQAINERLNFFQEKTLPVIEQYRQEGRLVEIDGNPPAAEVWEAIRQSIQSLAKRS